MAFSTSDLVKRNALAEAEVAENRAAAQRVKADELMASIHEARRAGETAAERLFTILLTQAMRYVAADEDAARGFRELAKL